MQNISVTLPNDVVYVEGTVNGVNYTFTLFGSTSSGTIWTADVERATPDIYVCRISATNVSGNVAEIETTLFYGLQLITDRTADDVMRVQELTDIGENMTAAEIAEWTSSLKGAYNATDLNRVESAVSYVMNRLEFAGVIIPLEIRNTWTRSDFPSKAEMERYLENVRKIRAALVMLETVPEVPPDMEHFNFEEANDIEEILLAVDEMITKIILAWYYSNELYAGEV